MKKIYFFVLTLLFTCIAYTAGATHYSVTTLNGTAPGSLTWAVTQVDSNYAATISNPDVIDICVGGSTSLNGIPIHSCVFNCPKNMSLTLSGIYFNIGRNLAGTRITFNNVVFTGNTGTAFGSAFMGSSNASYVFNNCLFTNNNAQYQAGGIFMNGDTAFINGCTFYNNTTTNAGGQGGAAVYNNGGYVSLTNCTFSHNSSVATGSTAGGGAVYNGGNMDIVNCTFYANHSAGWGGGLASPVSGGGFCNITNCVFLSNTADSSGANLSGTFSSAAGYNLIQDTAGAVIGAATTGNIYSAVTASVIDTVLRNNGYFQLTLALKTGSAAINAGTAAGAPATDQRGYGRNGATDMGAFEYQGVNPCPSFQTIINPVSAFCAPDTVTLTSNTTGGTMIGEANWTDGTNYFCATQLRVFRSGTYTYFTSDTNNCAAQDSIVLQLSQPAVSNLNATICTGESFHVGTHVYTTGGAFRDTLVGASAHGCDSIVNLNLTVNPLPAISISRNLYSADLTVPYVQAFGASSNSVYDSDNLPQNAFNNDTVIRGWGANSSNTPVYLQYDYGAGNGRALSSYGIYLSCAQLGGWCDTAYSPAQWAFQATNDTTWHTLDSVSGRALLLDTLYTFHFTNSTVYRKYRINIYATGGGGNYPHITEFYLAGADSLMPVSNITSNSIYNSDIPDLAFDDDSTNTGWVNNNSLPAWLQYDFGSGNAKVVNAYSIYNSCSMDGSGWCRARYNPKSWKFEGTNDTVWALLDTIANGNIVIGTRSVFPISNTSAYRKYRITITATTSGSYTRITEMELLQSSNICGGNVYAATVSNTSPAATLQWKVNGTNAGTGSLNETFSGLHSGDSVSCVLTDSSACAAVVRVASNSLAYVAGSSDTASFTVCKDSIVINGTRISQSGTYRDTVVNVHGCDSINTYILTVHNCPNGINELANVGFKLVPNPNNGVFSLEFSDNTSRDIQITNILGSIITEFENHLQQAQVDIGNQPAGIYIVSVRQNGQKQQVRFVIDK